MLFFTHIVYHSLIFFIILLFPAENFKNAPFLEISKSLQYYLPVESNAASLPGNVCNFYSVSAPAISSAWPLPSASGTSFQPLMGGAYFYQHSSKTMLSGVPAASNPGVFEWALTEGSEKKLPSLRDFTVTVTDQDTAVSSVSLVSQCEKTTDVHNMVPLYPSLPISLVQEAPSHIPNQGHSLPLPYQEYNQGPLLSAESGPYLQSYGSMSYTKSRASAPEPGMVMVLKEAQVTNMIPPVSTSGIRYSVPPQPITKTSFQGEYEQQQGRGIRPAFKTRVNLQLANGGSLDR